MSSINPPPGESEILESGGGDPTPAPRRGRRTALLAVGALAGVGVVGGAAWAATWYLSSGPQPAEALPASTIGYVSLNLDPSGEQLLAARETLEKFPAWQDEEISSQGDLRAWLFEQFQEEANCEGLDYGDDIEPWLGDRVAAAAVDAGEEEPTPVVVVEVTDADAARDGVDALMACEGQAVADETGAAELEPLEFQTFSATDPDNVEADDAAAEETEETEEGDGGYAIEGEWMVVAETTEIAEQVLADAQENPLSDDEDYQQMTDEAGDVGIMTMYAAPEAADVLIDLAGQSGTEAEELDAIRTAYEDFGGAAAHVRFADGSVEMEFAGEFAPDLVEAFSSDAGDDVVATLPSDTALALGYGFEPGWVDAIADQMAPALDMTRDELYAEVESETGMSLPEDLETLLGESAAVGVSGQADIDAMVNSGDFSSLQFAAKVRGDAGGIEDVLEKVRTAIGPEADQLLSRAEGDYVVVGIDQDAVDAFTEEGDLGDQEDYQDVVPESDQSANLFYLNADVGDDWLVSAVESADAPEDVVENVRPLKALGASGWYEDGVAHGKLKLTTD